MNKKQAIVFTVLLLSLGFICRYFDRDTIDLNSQSPWLGIWAISPLLVTLGFRLFTKDWKGFGLKMHLASNWKWYALSTLIFPVITTANLMIGKVTGSLVFTDKFSFTILLAAIMSGFLPMFIKNIFEEFTWRGYLTQKLNDGGMEPTQNHLWVGVIWALWHFPYLDLMIRSYSTMSFWLAIPLFFIATVITAFVYGEIRLRSKTVWTAVLLHTLGNSITNPFIYMKMIQLVPGKEYMAAPGMDNLAYIFMILLVVFYLFKKSKLQQS